MEDIILRFFVYNIYNLYNILLKNEINKEKLINKFDKKGITLLF